ncbi:hypothetical protein Mal15_31220 [Stieleria maiorica]|uniref:Uncharacterized protein n=1 Tax=Stieleria maiorica TaxID=2795974 RepID=A0A5B9ME28_9BACT|nr:hypothetical protein Mal15_31220 [Stieleria maiorica]
MTLQPYDACLGFLNLPAKEREWFPRWMKAYADFPSVVADQSAAPNHTVKRELEIAFLQSLRDRKIEAWRRLHAARAIEAYQGTVFQTSETDFRPIRETLQQLARRQSSGAGVQNQQDANLVAGEGNAGVIDQSEPECVQRMRATMRRLHQNYHGESRIPGSDLSSPSSRDSYWFFLLPEKMLRLAAVPQVLSLWDAESPGATVSHFQSPWWTIREMIAI